MMLSRRIFAFNNHNTAKYITIAKRILLIRSQYHRYRKPYGNRS